MANVAIFQIALAMKFVGSWPLFFMANVAISGFWKKFAHFWPFLGLLWPNLTFQFHTHESLWQRTNFSNNFYLRIFRFSSLGRNHALWKFFKKHFVKFLFQFEIFAQIIT